MNLKRKFTTLIFLILPLFAQANIANNIAQHSLMPTASFFEVNATLKANDKKDIADPFDSGFNFGAKCRINTRGKTVHFEVEILKGKGKVNNKEYSKESGVLNIAVSDGDVFDIYAVSGSRVTIVLLPEEEVDSVEASCSVYISL